MDKTMATALVVIIVSVVAILVLSLASTGRERAESAGGRIRISTATGIRFRHRKRDDPDIYIGCQRVPVPPPAEIRVKQGTKVRIEGDTNTLVGCMSTVNIDGYEISKYIESGDNVIEFTADTAGTFPIHCNMGMGNGKLIVEDNSGTVPVQSQAPAVATGKGECCG